MCLAQDTPSAQKDLIASLNLGENEQNCFSILARLFPGQTAASVMCQQSPVVVTHVKCSSSNTSIIRPLATPPLQQELGVARQWELLSRPLPPIKGDRGWCDEEKKFHYEMNQIKKKVHLPASIVMYHPLVVATVMDIC